MKKSNSTNPKKPPVKPVAKNSVLIIALAKIDKLGIVLETAVRNVDSQFLKYGVETENMGGNVQIIPVNGITGDGLEELVEGLVLQSQIMDLRAQQGVMHPGEATVIDSRVEKGLGVVVDVVV
eukprot:CAMPEP_0194384442 /NCGR_PEP_ID=MMETSP0174-20130528/73968_1 /TAXON_ID=216777 /ORGANISM="Proboscia alata, Strain PI-D3" /LENGTH=122 /DNA_ID=CAMNT_0039171629 /DNA_START=181 /DNA_END=545 /DNA_ORIENTATION=+